MAQQMAKTPICALLRIGWDTVGQIVERVVSDHLDERRLAGLVMVGVDEISYRRGQRYLTQVCDHHTGAIVWARPGRNATTEDDGFGWPRRDGLKWPHLALVGVVVGMVADGGVGVVGAGRP